MFAILTSMITQDTFLSRRTALAETLKKPLVLAAHTRMQAKADTPFKFVEDASFFYYTGLEAPDWKLLFDGTEWHLVAPEVDAVHAVFDGSLSHDEARETSGIQSVISQKDYEEKLAEISKPFNEIALLGPDPMADHYDFHLNPAQENVRIEVEKHFKNTYDCRLDINRQRAIKTADEIEEIRRAIDATIGAFEKVKGILPTAEAEYELEAHLNYEFRINGLNGHAYDPIVAAGKNACTLHYVSNNAKLPENGSVLIDSGAKSNGYAADITRTYAIGIPSEREKAVHAAVENAHHEIIALLKPELSVKEYHEKVEVIMKSALSSLGLLKSEADYHTYFPHSISHGLGVDVHDPLGRPEVFKPGMVLTVEPGIYIPEEGIGVRIEDDILITETGAENLSGKLPTSL